MVTKNLIKSIPTDNVDEACQMIADFIRSNSLSAKNINEIYYAIAESECVLGSKLWTNEDIKLALNDSFGSIGEILDNATQNELVDNIDTYVLKNRYDTEWESIIDDIRTSNIFVRVEDIDWDIEREACDSDEEYEEILANMPKNIEIPINEFKGYSDYDDCISDYIDDNYGYCYFRYGSCKFVTTKPR